LTRALHFDLLLCASRGAQANPMQIDRTRFLLLTATMAGGGCGQASPGPAASAPVVAAPLVSLPSGSPAEAEPPPEARAQAGEPEEGEYGDPPDEEPLAEEGDPGAPGTLSCNDVGAAPKSCASLRAPGPQCESFSYTKTRCAALAKGLRPRVAEAAIDCILARSGKPSICAFDVESVCVTTAMRRACIDASTQSACAPVVGGCRGGLKMNDCQALLSSVAAKHHSRMITCMTEGCSIDYCTYDF
jgi:hypothetical protein